MDESKLVFPEELSKMVDDINQVESFDTTYMNVKMIMQRASKEDQADLLNYYKDRILQDIQVIYDTLAKMTARDFKFCSQYGLYEVENEMKQKMYLLASRY